MTQGNSNNGSGSNSSGKSDVPAKGPASPGPDRKDPPVEITNETRPKGKGK